jgi:hypothetical protein
VGVEILNLPSALERKLFKTNHLKMGISARGGLEPLFRVLFSAVFQVLPCGISIRVENCGIERKENCSRSTYKIFGCFWWSSAFPPRSEESELNAVSSAASICGANSARPAPGVSIKRWQAGYRSTHPGHFWTLIYCAGICCRPCDA